MYVANSRMKAHRPRGATSHLLRERLAMAMALQSWTMVPP